MLLPHSLPYLSACALPLLLLLQVYLAAVLLLSHRDRKEPGLLLVQEGRAQYAVGAAGCALLLFYCCY